MQHALQNQAVIRVLVADSSPFHTQLLVGILSHDSALRVTRSELNAASVVSASIAERIDVFVLSASVDGDAQPGFAILHKLLETHPKARAVMLLDSSQPEAALEAFRAGAKAVFDHQESPDVLCQCIRKVHQGQVWVNDEQMAAVLDALAAAPRVRAVTGNGKNLLSKREADVVNCVAAGLTNREISERLGLSQHTIKNHMCRIFDKLGVSSRVEMLFMTVRQNTSAPLLLDALLKDSAGDYDEATLAVCERAAELGSLSAQLMLARTASAGRTSDTDVIRSYMWSCVASDLLAHTKNTVKKTLNTAQVAEAERRASEWLNRSHRIAPSLSRAASVRGNAVA